MGIDFCTCFVYFLPLESFRDKGQLKDCFLTNNFQLWCLRNKKVKKILLRKTRPPAAKKLSRRKPICLQHLRCHSDEFKRHLKCWHCWHGSASILLLSPLPWTNFHRQPMTRTCKNVSPDSACPWITRDLRHHLRITTQWWKLKQKSWTCYRYP